MVLTKISQIFVVFSIIYLPTTLLAEPKPWNQSKWILEVKQSKALIQDCSNTICEKTNLKREKFNKELQQHSEVKSWAEPKIVSIGEWMKKKGFPQARTWSAFEGDPGNQVPAGQMRVVDNLRDLDHIKVQGRKLTKKEKIAIKQTAASYGPLSSIISLSKQDFINSVDRLNNVHSLAHELFHAVHYGVTDKANKDPDWITEGLAEAVGYAWVGAKSDSTIRDPKYDTPLADPKDPYERGHFFHELGKSLKGGIKYAGQIIKERPKGDGVKWLDDYLVTAGTSLSKYYPEFIAKKTNNYFYSDQNYLLPKVTVHVPSSGKSKTKIKINEVAASYKILNVDFQNTNAAKLKDKDKVYLLDVNITNADRTQDLSLIVKRVVKKGSERHLSMVFAQEGSLKFPLVAKVTNVAEKAEESRPQKFNLNLEASPVIFKLPSCVKVNSQTNLSLIGNITAEEFSKIKGVRLKVSAGKITNSLEFTAPKQPQKVKVSLIIPTLAGKSKRIKLGTINVGKGPGDSDGIESNYILRVKQGYAQGRGGRGYSSWPIPNSPIAVSLSKDKKEGKLMLRTLDGVSIAFDLNGSACGGEYIGVGRFVSIPYATIKLVFAMEGTDSVFAVGNISATMGNAEIFLNVDMQGVSPKALKKGG